MLRVIWIAACVTVLAVAFSPTDAEMGPPKASPTVRITSGESICSGVYLGNGYVLTAAHCEDKSLTVETDLGAKMVATKLWANHQFDLMLLEVPREVAIQAAVLSCRVPQPGERVISAGNPYGVAFLEVAGIIAGKERAFAHWPESVPVALTMLGGMSGGPTFDESGEVVGINVGGLLAEVHEVKDNVKTENVIGLTASGINWIVPGATACRLMGRSA